MTSPEDARDRIMATLTDHFGRTEKHLTPEEVADMTGLELGLVQNSLRVLHKMNKIEAVVVAELAYPVKVTDVVW
jgi:hypothetical protein